MPTNYQQLAEELAAISEPANDAEELMSAIVECLRERLPHFNWVGFYMIEKDAPGEDPMLVLGPYVGDRNTAQTHSAQPGNLWRCCVNGPDRRG